MRNTIKFLVACIAFSLSSSSFALPELPFCPAGGPPGWFNYFNDSRDHNTWQQHYYRPPHPPGQSYYNNYPRSYNPYQVYRTPYRTRPPVSPPASSSVYRAMPQPGTNRRQNFPGSPYYKHYR